MIWVVVAGLNVATIIAFSEEHEKALRPLLLMIGVPPVLYGIGIAWEWLRRKRKPSADAGN